MNGPSPCLGHNRLVGADVDSGALDPWLAVDVEGAGVDLRARVDGG